MEQEFSLADGSARGTMNQSVIIKIIEVLNFKRLGNIEENIMI